MAIKVFTDACSNLFKSFLDDHNLEITVLPMQLDFEDKKYVCYTDDIDIVSFSKSFYNDMRSGKKPKTTLVNPQLFLDLVEKEVEEGNQVVYISMASGISGTFNAARLMALDVNEKAGKEVVHIIDSRTAGFGEGLVAMRCYKLAQSGLSFEEVIKETEDYVLRVRSEFTVDDLQYLAGTGRVSRIVAKIASTLSIKPLLYGSNEAKIEMTSKVHGRVKAIKTLAMQVVNHIDNPDDQTVYISHCDSEEDANKLKDILVANGIKNVEVYYYDLISGAHVGPGTLAVFYEGTSRAIKKTIL